MKIFFEKSITRDWPLLILEMLHEGFTKEFKKQFKFGYSEVLFDFFGDHVDIYRSPKEHLERICQQILKRLKKDNNFISVCSKRLLNFYKKFIQAIKKTDKIKIEQFSNQRLYKVFNSFFKIHKKLEPTFVINFWFPIQMENHPDKEKWQRQINIAVKTRSATEAVGPEGDRIMRKFAVEICRRMFGHKKYFKVLLKQEVFEFLIKNKLPDKKDLERRLKGFVYGKRGVKFINLKHYATLDGYGIQEVKKENLNVIRGQAAFRGKVKGIVRIILSKDKIKDFKNNEVLVSLFGSKPLAFRRTF
jgi:hypothetical protein